MNQPDDAWQSETDSLVARLRDLAALDGFSLGQGRSDEDRAKLRAALVEDLEDALSCAEQLAQSALFHCTRLLSERTQAADHSSALRDVSCRARKLAELLAAASDVAAVYSPLR